MGLETAYEEMRREARIEKTSLLQPDLNEAPAAADAFAYLRSDGCLSAEISFGSQGGIPCDPSTKMMLEELQRRHYA